MRVVDYNGLRSMRFLNCNYENGHHYDVAVVVFAEMMLEQRCGYGM